MKPRHYHVELSSKHMATFVVSLLFLLFLSFSFGFIAGTYSRKKSQEPVKTIPQEKPQEPTPSLPTEIPEPQEKKQTQAKVIEKAQLQPTPPQPPPKKEPIKKPKPPAKYTLQLLATESSQKAQEWLEKLLASGYDDAYMMEVKTNQKKMIRIRVGHFQTKAQANKVRQKLLKEPFIQKANIKNPLIIRY